MQKGAEIITRPKIDYLLATKKYANLRSIITESGILDRSYGYYAFLSTISITGFFLSAFNLFINSSPVALTFSMIAFIFFTVQITGLVHDAGHRAIFKSAKNNDIFGFFVSSIVNFGFTYWKFKHNKHHANPNEIGEDPDVDIPLLSFTKNKKQTNWLTSFALKYQAYLYYPLGSLVSLYERYKSLEYTKNKFNQVAFLELIIFFLSTFFWFVLPFMIMSPAKALVLIVVANLGNGLYLANIFAPNHKGMPQYKKGTKITFLEQQVLTARNIKGNWLVDFFYIGLNYQTEHHLFPNCPRNKLKLITPHLKKLCKETELKYSETGIIESNRQILSSLNQVALAA